RGSLLRFQDMYVDALKTFLKTLRRDEIIRPHLNVESAARSLYAVSRNCFRLYLMMESATRADLRAMLSQDLSTVFEGFLAQQVTVPRRAKRSAGKWQSKPR